MTIEQELAQANEIISTLRAEATANSDALAAAQTTITEHASTIATLTGERDTASADLVAANARIGELETQLASATRANDDFDTRVAAEAARIAAESGVDALRLTNANKPTKAESAEELREQMAAIKDPSERAKFYAKHEAGLFAA